MLLYLGIEDVLYCLYPLGVGRNAPLRLLRLWFEFGSKRLLCVEIVWLPPILLLENKRILTVKAVCILSANKAYIIWIKANSNAQIVV